MATFWRDIRFGAHALLHAPGFTVVAVLTLALGVGSKRGDLQHRGAEPF